MTPWPMSELWKLPSGAAPWSHYDFGLVLIMWAIMMMAMMLPSSLPMVLAFTKVCHAQQKPVYRLCTFFVMAYLFIWFFYCALLTLLQWQMHQLSWLSPMMESQSTIMAASILFLAGLYQFVPFKNSCLRKCRTPTGFLVNEWQDGNLGSFNMGLKHGANCLGCCWAEMLIMFAVGVMSIPGMALLTCLILLEKLAPFPSYTICRAGGIIFLGWSALLLY